MGSTNLCNHLLKKHTKVYNKAIGKHNWPYKSSMQVNKASTHKVIDVSRQDIPPYSHKVLVEFLTCFIVADD